MDLNIREDSELSKPGVLCVEYDGEITCFELGNLPLPPKDPKELGIVLPCCGKKFNDQKHSKKDHCDEKDCKITKNDFCYRRTKSVPKRPNSKESPVSPVNSINNTSLVYVFDKNGFNKVIAYTKANIDCADSADLKVSLRSSHLKRLEKKSDNSKKKRIFSTFSTTGIKAHACKSRELRGGILSTDCFCLRRNGLQYDCRRTGCQNSPECSLSPGPVCEPARVACNTHRSNPHAQALSDICKIKPW